MKKIILLSFCALFFQYSHAQISKEVLFIGNSYFYFANTPQLLFDVAVSLGDTMIYDQHTPGGTTLQDHSTDPISFSKINQRNWDVVLMQEQSQRPSFSPAQVAQDVFPYADSLVRFVNQNDSCTIPMFFMTWGRMNGDATNCVFYPPVCTYNGMQQRLRDSYVQMGNLFEAEVSPVGSAWRRVRDAHPTLNLYSGDGSHPNTHGGYLSAVTFYASIFHKSPIGATFPSGINAADALILQQIADSVVFDSLATWNMDTKGVKAAFSSNAPNGNDFLFTNNSSGGIKYVWDFGDGNTSYQTNPLHTYNMAGTYIVTLIAKRRCAADTLVDSVFAVLTGVNELVDGDVYIYPNPVHDEFKIAFNYSQTFPIHFRILSAEGKLIKSGETNKELISVEDLPEGIYLLELDNGKSQSTSKFIKLN